MKHTTQIHLQVANTIASLKIEEDSVNHFRSRSLREKGKGPFSIAKLEAIMEELDEIPLENRSYQQQQVAESASEILMSLATR